MRDHKGRPIAVITGLGVMTCLGRGIEENWRKLTGGESGIHAITRFDTTKLKTKIAGTIDETGDEADDETDSDCFSASKLTYDLAQSAASEAIENSGLDDKDFGGPLFLAAPPVELEWFQRFELDKTLPDTSLDGYDKLLEAARRGSYHDTLFKATQFGHLADCLARRFATSGLPVSLSTACASGATAVQLGLEAIRRGETEKALCVAADGSVTLEALIRFSLLSALSTQNENPQKAAKPFSKGRDGFVMAEGAGALVLESLEHAKARGAPILAVLKGCGERADHFHRTRSSPDGAPVIAAMRNCLEDGGIEADQVDYINAHGTSTPENDRMEYLALKEIFMERVHKVPISSNKSMIGHTLTAAGAIEAVFSVLTLTRELMPPTINYDIPDPDIELDVVPNESRRAAPQCVLSNSFGFGGQNTCLVFGRHLD